MIVHTEKSCQTHTTSRTRKYGEGSVFLRGDGRWAAKYKDDSLPRPITRYAKTEAEAKRKLRELKKEVARGILPTRKVFVPDYIERWLFTVKCNTIRGTTLDNYEDVLNTHIRPKLAHRQMGNVTSMELQELLNATVGRMAYRSAKWIRDCLKFPFEYAEACGDIQRNPMAIVELPSPEFYIDPREIEILEAEEVEAFEKIARERCFEKNFRLAPLIVFLLKTGLRWGELMALPLDLVSWDMKRLSVEKTLTKVKNRNRKGDGERKEVWELHPPKTPNSIRVVPMSQGAMEYLRLFLDVRRHFSRAFDQSSPYICKTPRGWVSYTAFYNCVFRMLEEACIDKDISGMHFTRHTFATRLLQLLIENAINPEYASKVLGHKNVSTTLDYYSHLLQRDLVDGLECLEAV